MWRLLFLFVQVKVSEKKGSRFEQVHLDPTSKKSSPSCFMKMFLSKLSVTGLNKKKEFLAQMRPRQCKKVFEPGQTPEP